MQNFLVVSFDLDEQQFFYDTVCADNSGDAEERICRLRPYVNGASATDVPELGRMAKRVKAMKPKDIQKNMDVIVEESGLECDCDDRSWRGEYHDSACQLAGEPNPNSLLKK
jgi:hypothetical protein